MESVEKMKDRESRGDEIPGRLERAGQARPGERDESSNHFSFNWPQIKTCR